MAESKRRRTPDGRPELRSLDDMLKQAVEDEDLTQLPGYGEPIDLTGYATSDPETRVASKLLGDHNVLPQPLQDRKDAENRRREADDYLRGESEHLLEMMQRIEPVAAAFTAPFPDRQAVLEVLGTQSWPSYLPEPTGADLPRRQTFRQTGKVLLEQVSGYNRRIEVVVSQYLERLGRFNDCVERISKQISLAPGLPAEMIVRAADLVQEEETARAQLESPLTALPADIEPRLDRYYRSVSPSAWQRLTRTLRAD